MGCRNCDNQQGLTLVEVDQLVAEQLAVESELASEEQRLERLQICLSCPFLTQHTCMKCGCFVKFRGALRLKACPVNKW